MATKWIDKKMTDLPTAENLRSFVDVLDITDRLSLTNNDHDLLIWIFVGLQSFSSLGWSLVSFGKFNFA